MRVTVSVSLMLGMCCDSAVFPPCSAGWCGERAVSGFETRCLSAEAFTLVPIPVAAAPGLFLVLIPSEHVFLCHDCVSHSSDQGGVPNFPGSAVGGSPCHPMASGEHQAPLVTEDDNVAQREAICPHFCSKLGQPGPLHGCSLHKGPWVGAIRTEVRLAQFRASRRHAIDTSVMGAFRPGHFCDKRVEADILLREEGSPGKGDTSRTQLFWPGTTSGGGAVTAPRQCQMH